MVRAFARTYLPDMSHSTDVRRYSDSEVARILERAARRQSAGEGRSGGLTLAELEQAAREAGIDPRLVREAALEVELHSGAGPRFLGGPLVARAERVVPGQLPPAADEALLEEIRHTFGEIGASSRTERALLWSSADPTRHPGRATVEVRSDQGRVTISAEASLAPEAGGIFGGLLGGLGGGGIGVSLGVGFGVLGSIALGLGGSAIFGVGAYALARGIYSGLVRRRGARLSTLVERLAERLAPGSAAQLPADQ